MSTKNGSAGQPGKPQNCGWRLLPDLIQDVKDLAEALGIADNAAAAMLLREGLTAYSDRHGVATNQQARRYRA